MVDFCVFSFQFEIYRILSLLNTLQIVIFTILIAFRLYFPNFFVSFANEMVTAKEIIGYMESQQDDAQRQILMRFFKTGPGEYGVNRTNGHLFAAKARQKLLNTDTYTKIGNTMYCIFDDFGPIDTQAWTAFYKGTGSLPTYNPEFKGDICGIVEALDKAAADPEVKNFVLDLTCNNGGDLGVLQTITTLLAGKRAVTYENVLTKQRGVNEALVDANFDRVFLLSDFLSPFSHPQQGR